MINGMYIKNFLYLCGLNIIFNEKNYFYFIYIFWMFYKFFERKPRSLQLRG